MQFHPREEVLRCEGMTAVGGRCTRMKRVSLADKKHTLFRCWHHEESTPQDGKIQLRWRQTNIIMIQLLSMNDLEKIKEHLRSSLDANDLMNAHDIYGWSLLHSDISENPLVQEALKNVSTMNISESEKENIRKTILKLYKSFETIHKILICTTMEDYKLLMSTYFYKGISGVKYYVNTETIKFSEFCIGNDPFTAKFKDIKVKTVLEFQDILKRIEQSRYIDPTD